jgi:cation:H+ antiporter
MEISKHCRRPDNPAFMKNSLESRWAKAPGPSARRAAFSTSLVVLAGLPLMEVGPETALWATPAILLAAMTIAWAAESAQFFIAQGFALAILAWLQTLPEFAVEAVLAWKQQVPLLLANLTGALRLLTGLGWPMIYFTAAFFYRRRHGRPMRAIRLADEHCVEVVGLMAPLVYVFFIWWKASLDLVDAAVLIGIYTAYLLALSRMPPQEAERVDELELIPRSIVKARPAVRNFTIFALFAAGGLLIYFTAEPFLGSLLAVSAILGIPSFVFVQWVAPFVSEFPEKVSAFYWARTVDRASMALMNMVSSNINQWTLLAAMLPIVYSMSVGAPTPIRFDSQQELELLMTLGQSLVGMLFLVNMKMDWWEATALFVLWGVQFALSPVAPGPGLWGTLAGHAHWYVTILYFVWFGLGAIRCALGYRRLEAFHMFGKMWREHIRPNAAAAVK